MSHMVIYRTADGQPGYHQTDALEDAVSFVERLRNSDGVDSARIFRMEEVTFDFKPYFKVEVGTDMAAPVAPAAPIAAPDPAPLAAPTFAPPAAPEPMASPFAAAAPAEERSWMDLPIMDEPTAEPPTGPEPLVVTESAVAEVPTFGEPEHATPIFDTMPPPPPPPPPSHEDEAVGTSNGMGARRGLFGR